jgi:opacity protein-like surface antigen
MLLKSYLPMGLSALILSVGLTSANAADVAAETAPQQDLWYVSLFGGASVPQDLKTDFYSNQAIVDLNTGFVIGGTIGRRINDAFRVEGELSYARYKAGGISYKDNGVEDDFGDASGNVSATYLLANVWADVAHFGQATAYVGGGLGAAYVSADTHFYGNDYGYGPGQWGFAGQVGAGITYALASNIDVDFGYRFKAVTGIDFDDNDGQGVYTNGKLYTHNLQLGFNVKF